MEECPFFLTFIGKTQLRYFKPDLIITETSLPFSLSFYIILLTAKWSKNSDQIYENITAKKPSPDFWVK